MKLRQMPMNLATHLHRPLRFGRYWRGHELLLRIVQLILVVLLAAEAAKPLAHFLSESVQALARLLT